MAPHTRSTCRRGTPRRYAGTSAGISSTHAGRQVAVAPAGHVVTVTTRRPCASGRGNTASRSASEDASLHPSSPNTRRRAPEREPIPEISSGTPPGAPGTAPGHTAADGGLRCPRSGSPSRPAGRTAGALLALMTGPGLSAQPPARPRSPETPQLSPCAAASSAAGRTRPPLCLAARGIWRTAMRQEPGKRGGRDGAAGVRAGCEVMKAIVQDRFGPPEALRLADVDLPESGLVTFWSGCTPRR